jgi:hypothetical protein
MPQFRPYWWINLISWILFTFTFLIWFNQSINLPKILKTLLSRYLILFQ